MRPTSVTWMATSSMSFATAEYIGRKLRYKYCLNFSSDANNNRQQSAESGLIKYSFGVVIFNHWNIRIGQHVGVLPGFYQF
ncbi:MAG: hypothetical protein ACI9UN_005020 [Granulosicoccus sp.]|jgi:hypothetical protein